MPLAARTIELLPLESQAGTHPSLRCARSTGETMFPPWAPFFGVLTAGRITAARNKFRSATKTCASALERSAEGLESACVEEDKADNFDRRRPRLPYRGDRHGRRELDRIAVHPGRDRREGDRAAAERRRELERAPVARREQLRLTLAAAPPHRADRVDHVAGAQAPRTRRLRVSGRAAAEEPALGEQRRARSAVDRAVHPTAAEQARVRRVDDRVGVLLGDVTMKKLDHAANARP